jgi:hypothetical protein
MIGKKVAAVAVVVALSAGVGAVTAQAVNGPDAATMVATANSTRALGNGISENRFVPIVPCRILDTRQATAGRLQLSSTRTIDVRGNEITFGIQGGNPGGCGIPNAATAIEATITAVDAGSGFLRAWPANLAQPNATFMNYGPGLNVSNTGTITLCGYTGGGCVGNQDLNLRAYGSATHLVIDVAGYYVPPMSAVVNFNGALSRNSRAVASVRGAVGAYTVTFDRSVDACTYFTNAGNLAGAPQAGMVTATSNLVNPNAIEVRTFNPAGAATDLSFHLEVIC